MVLALIDTTLASCLTMSSYVEQQLITNFDLKAHGPAGYIAKDSVDMQVDDLTCGETALM